MLAIKLLTKQSQRAVRDFTYFPSDQPEISMLAKARHSGMAPRSCSLRALLVEITVYSAVSQTFSVPSAEAVAKRSLEPSSKTTFSTPAVWLSEITMDCRLERFTLDTVPTDVVAST